MACGAILTTQSWLGISWPYLNRKGKGIMNVKEIVQQVKDRAPAQLGNLPDARAVRLLREAFAVVLGELESKDQGVVNVGGLGTFRIRMVEVEIDGKIEMVKRIVFVPVPPKI